MTVLRQGDGTLLFYDAVPVDDATLEQLRALGRPAVLIVPNQYHSLDAPARAHRLLPRARGNVIETTLAKRAARWRRRSDAVNLYGAPPMRRLLSPLLVVLCACPEPPPVDCTRTLVDSFGNVNGGFAGGIGGGGGTPEAPLGLVGAPLRFTVFAPLSACAPDVLRADATVLDPDNAPVEFTLEGPLVRSAQQNAVSGTFNFTPRKPGLHTLRVAFEPSLGVRSVLVDVASDGLLGATRRVPIASANCTVWPLTDDTVACEAPGGSVSITSVDGGVTRFSGAELVVVDNVLWSIDGASNTLERRVYEDGGVRVSNRIPGFPVVATPALQEVDVALRYRANGLITRVRITPNGEAVGDFAVDRFVGPPLAYFIEADDTLYRSSNTDCFSSSSSCTNFTGLVAIDQRAVWSTLNGFERPFRTPPNPRFSLKRQPVSNGSPAHAFERIPLWLQVTSGDRRFLVSTDDGSVSYSAWPFSQVLNVGQHHVVLTDSPGFVRVVKR